MNYYDRILGLLESSYKMPSGRGKAIAGEYAARRRFKDFEGTSLTRGGKVNAPEKAKRVMNLSPRSQAELHSRSMEREGKDIYGNPKKKS